MNKIIKTFFILITILFLTSCDGISKQQLIKQTEKAIAYFNYSDFANIGALESPWYERYNVIAHAFGGIDSYDYTNSYEALVANYNLGTRVFEIDIATTSNGDLVLLHEWNQYHEEFGLGEKDGWTEESTEFFLNNKIYGKYTTMTFADLIKIMNVVEDIYLVLDSKTFDTKETKEVYSHLLHEIDLVNSDLTSRIIPQAYSPEIYNVINELERFDDIIFTLYHYYVSSDGYNIYNFVKEKKIRNIVMHMNDDWAKRVIRDVRDYSMYDEEWNYENINIYIHTINDLDTSREIIFKENFKGIYSDFISENQIKNIMREK